MKLTSVTRTANQTVLVYGPPKTGKTELVGKLALHFNLLWFDMENGSATLFKLPPEAQARVELVSLPDTRSYPIAIETCLKVIKGANCKICSLHGKVGCQLCSKANVPESDYVEVCLSKLGPDTIVVFDSLTQLTNSAISHITKGQPEDYKMTYDDFGHLGKLMDIFLSHAQAAPCNLICISHEQEVEMEDGKAKIVPVAGTRNFSRNTAKYFGHVVYCRMAANKHSFSSSTTAVLNTVAGSRLDVAVEKMAEASLLSIFQR